jgi:hypothetical protein
MIINRLRFYRFGEKVHKKRFADEVIMALVKRPNTAVAAAEAKIAA